jgi:hypothetical protein
MAERYFIGQNLLGDIRRVVDRVDGKPEGRPATRVTRSPVVEGDSAQVFRVGSATGSWNKAATKTVTWTPVGTVTATFVATNLFANITGTTATYSCAVARVGATWYLVAAECT